MTVDEVLRRGGACDAAGDLDGAEAAYREADEFEDAEGAILLGLVLKRRGDMTRAAEALQRAESRGHPEAASCLGDLLSDSGDFAAAKTAYERAIAAGSTMARLNLGLLLAQHGAMDEALPHLRAAEESGDPNASWAIGKILEGRQDLRGAATAYRRGAEGGNGHAAFGLGAVLEKLGDREGARAAMQRAHDLGHENASKVLEHMDIEADARASAQSTAEWAQLYVAACGEVLSAANACLQAANRAVTAQNMLTNRPYGYRNTPERFFRDAIERSTQQFAPLYQTFDEACTAARDTAAQLLASSPDTAEWVLAASVGDDQQTLDNVATVRGILGATFGPSPAAFVQGVEQANGLMQNSPDEDNIYRPAAATQSDERTCPWCAETIKSAAVICRFCGRDVQTQPNVG